MMIRTLILAAAVSVATLATADRADAQWRRYRTVVYPTYSYPVYSSGAVVTSGYTPTYVEPSSVVTAGYTPSYFTTPYQSMYYGNYNNYSNYSNYTPVYTSPYVYRPYLFPRRYWGW